MSSQSQDREVTQHFTDSTATSLMFLVSISLQCCMKYIEIYIYVYRSLLWCFIQATCALHLSQTDFWLKLQCDITLFIHLFLYFLFAKCRSKFCFSSHVFDKVKYRLILNNTHPVSLSSCLVSHGMIQNKTTFTVLYVLFHIWTGPGSNLLDSTHNYIM